MDEIKCLLCEKPLEIPTYIDTEDYDGEVVCQECKSLLYIRILKSKVKKYKFKEAGFSKKYGETLGAGMVKQISELVEKRRQELEDFKVLEEEKHGN